MRLILIFSSLLFLSCLVEGSPTPIKDLVQMVVMFIELTLQKIGNIDLAKEYSYLNFTNEGVLEGSLGFQNIYISNLDNLKVDQNNIDFTLTDPIFSFCANLSIPDKTKLEVTKYDADIAIFNTIPLYGAGKLLLGISDMDFALCGSVNLSQPVQLTEFLLKPNMTGLDFELTGFWKNDELSEDITKWVVTLEELIMLFWTKEIDCITCILSISLEHMINDLLDPNTAIRDFYQIAQVTKSDCQGDCTLSEFPILKTIFNTNTSDILNLVSQDIKLRNFVNSMAEYLTQYLNEQL